MDAHVMQSVPLNPEQYRNTWRFYLNDVTAKHCARIVRSEVLSQGVRLQWPDDAPEEQASYCRRHMNLFAQRALDWIICVGVVPIAWRYHAAVATSLPHVLSHTQAHIRLVQDHNGVTAFVAHITGDVAPALPTRGRANDSAMVWSGTDTPPDDNGDIVTAVSSLEDTQRLLHFWLDNTSIALQLSSNPVLVTTNRSHANRDTDGVVWNVDEETAMAAERARIERVEQMAQHQQSYRDTDQREWGRKLWRDGHCGEQCRPKEYYLPEDRDTARTPAPTPPPHVMDMLRWADEKIYAAFGVPPSMFSNTGARVGARDDPREVFDTQMARLRSTVEDCMNDALRMCSGTVAGEGTGPRATSDVRAKRKRGRPAVALPTATLPPVPRVSPSECIDWWRLGFLTFDEANECIRSYARLGAASAKADARRDKVDDRADT